MAFNHTCSKDFNVGICDCGDMEFYRPDCVDDITDKMYDWVLQGNEWHKLRFVEHSLEALVESECLFARYTSDD